MSESREFHPNSLSSHIKTIGVRPGGLGGAAALSARLTILINVQLLFFSYGFARSYFSVSTQHRFKQITVVNYVYRQYLYFYYIITLIV